MAEISSQTCTTWLPLALDRPIKQEILEEPDTINPQEPLINNYRQPCSILTNPTAIKIEHFNIKKEIVATPATQVSSIKQENFEEFSLPLPSKSYSCLQCPKSFPKPILLAAHVKQCHTRPYSCPKCKKSFHYQVSCDQHMKQHDAPEKPYKCNLCSRAFILKLHLDEHLRAHYRDRPFSCTTCGKSFRTYVLCKQHMKVHAEGYKQLTCNICFKKLRKASSLAAHLDRHAQPQEHTCSECGKVFSAARFLTAHRRTHAKPFVCNICNRRFTARHALNKHIANHSEVKMLFCIHCCKAFSLKRSLTVHLRTHTSEFAFMCNSCGKGFSQEAEFQAHCLSGSCKDHYDCATCKRSFKSPAGLARHTLVHYRTQLKSTVSPKINGGSKSKPGDRSKVVPVKENFLKLPSNIRVCGQCYCVFTKASAFTKHVLQHWNSSRSTCSSCLKRFSSGRILSQHYASHAKIHKCPHCAVTFTRVPFLKKHMQSHKFEKKDSRYKILKCRKCGKACPDYRSYVAHARILCLYARGKGITREKKGKGTD